MSRGQAYGSTEPGLSIQLVLSTCPWMLWQFINDPRAKGTSHLTAQNSLSFVIAWVESLGATQLQRVAREALGWVLLEVGA